MERAPHEIAQQDQAKASIEDLALVVDTFHKGLKARGWSDEDAFILTRDYLEACLYPEGKPEDD